MTPLYSTVTPDASRGLSADLWRQSLVAYVSNDPAFGVRIQDDFTKPFTNTTDATAVEGWFIQDAAAGGTSESFVSTASPDGVATLSAATGTADFGVEAHYGVTATSVGCVALPTHPTQARGRVVYEARVDLDDAGVVFAGFTEPIVQFFSATSGLPVDSDYIGFYRGPIGTEDIQFVLANDNAGGTAVTDSVTLPAAAVQAGWNKLGFAVNKDQSVDIVVNGVWYGTLAKTVNPLALPVELLTPKYAITCGDATTAVDLPIDSLDVFIEAA